MNCPDSVECDWWEEAVPGRCWREEVTEVIMLYEQAMMDYAGLKGVIRGQRNDIVRLRKVLAEANARLEVKLQVGLGL